ncbi:MAG: hypothetical protein U1E22_09085 [Coriobacteriia bacterium]|nr:hypothetical protein [Coriobacteriia bacterium]
MPQRRTPVLGGIRKGMPGRAVEEEAVTLGIAGTRAVGRAGEWRDGRGL